MGYPFVVNVREFPFHAAITWPKNVLWPAGESPSRGSWKTMDIFEFCSDGTWIFGKVIGQGYVIP